MEGGGYTIIKPSFWNGRREIQDASHGKAGYLAPLSIWSNKAEGEVRGRRFRFTPRGWDQRRAEMTDMSGQVIATVQPVGWWGTRFVIYFGDAEYAWKVNGWNTRFTIYQGEKEVATVRPGGYFKPGTISRADGMPEKDFLPLVLLGLYQMQLYTAQTAAASGGAVSVAT